MSFGKRQGDRKVLMPSPLGQVFDGRVILGNAILIDDQFDGFDGRLIPGIQA
jgi:hypothetical protein